MPRSEQSFDLPSGLTQELEDAIDKHLTILQLKELFKLKRVQIKTKIVFGSLSERAPRVSDSGKSLESDADVFVIVSGTKYYRDISFGKEEGDSKFSKHIPNADMFLMSEDVVMERLQAAKTVLAKKARSVEEYTSGKIHGTTAGYIRRDLEDIRKSTILPQALLQGSLVSGEISPHLLEEAKQVLDVYAQTQMYLVRRLREITGQ